MSVKLQDFHDTMYIKINSNKILFVYRLYAMNLMCLGIIYDIQNQIILPMQEYEIAELTIQRLSYPTQREIQVMQRAVKDQQN